MTTADQEQTDSPQAEQIARLRSIWTTTHRRRDMLAFIRTCPREDWESLAEEYNNLANGGCAVS